MDPKYDLGPWIAIVRDLVLTLVPLILAAVLKKKFGLDIEVKRTELEKKKQELISTVVNKGIAYAEQLAASPLHPSTPNEPGAKNQAALEYSAPRLSPEVDVAKEIEAELGKQRLGVGPVLHADQLVVTNAKQEGV